MRRGDELHEVRIKVKGFEKYMGYSDLFETYCCSGTACYYVVFPETRYEGYFQKPAIELKRREKNG